MTIDFQTLMDNTVTVRDRDTMAQVRVPISALVGLLQQLCNETLAWSVVMTRYLVVKTGEEQEEPEESAAAEGAAAVSTVDTTSPVVLQYTPRGSFMVPNPNYIKK